MKHDVTDRKCVNFIKILSYHWHSYLIVYDNIEFIDNTKCTYNQYISKMAVTLTLIAACIQYVVVVVYFFNIHNLYLEIMINIYNKFVKILKNICFQTRSSTQGIYVRRGKVRIIIVRSMILPLVPYCCTYLTTLYCHT